MGEPRVDPLILFPDRPDLAPPTSFEEVPVKAHTRRRPRTGQPQGEQPMMTSVKTPDPNGEGSRAAATAAADALARSGDPETSFEAARHADLKGSEQAVLIAFLELCGRDSMRVTQDEVLELHLSDRYSPSRIRTARKSLERQGLIEFAETWGQSTRGRSCRLYRLTSAGAARAHELSLGAEEPSVR